ncbi:MAG: DUF2167 domain-containing protein [Caulobacterales bacterium]
MKFMPAFARVGMAAAALLLAAPAFADGPRVDTPDVAARPIERPTPPPPAAPATPSQPPVRAAPVAPAEPAATAPAPIGQTGAITLPGNTGMALNVPQNYRFYDAAQAQAFLQRNGAATPTGDILGLLMPAGVQPTQEGAWGTIVSFQPVGYVTTTTASRIAEPAFEAEVRAARAGQTRPFEGFYFPPGFEDIKHALTWAERSAAPGAGGRDLRYEQRLLGRNGVACLTTIGNADQQPDVQAAAPNLLSQIAFGAGQRYEDFNASTDRVSDYDVPGLISGLTVSQQQALIADAASTGQAAAAPVNEGGGLLGGMFPWIAIGIAVLAGIGYFIARAMRRRDDDYYEADDEPARDRRENREERDNDRDSDDDPNLTPRES